MRVEEPAGVLEVECQVGTGDIFDDGEGVSAEALAGLVVIGGVAWVASVVLPGDVFCAVCLWDK